MSVRNGPNKGSKHAKPKAYTHEQYIHAVRHFAAARIPEGERAALYAVKLVYGAGNPGLRGVTYYDTWNCAKGEGHAIAEICAFGEDSPVQIAGTTIHELAHTITRGAGHGKAWASACARLGLRFVRAAGTRYSLACFTPDVRLALAALPKPQDGQPTGAKGRAALMGSPLQLRLRPCGAGFGTRGGVSRGQGSGSRLRKFVCSCSEPVIVRAARDELRATCEDCKAQFQRADIPAKAAA